MEFNHKPVLLKECIEGLNIKEDGVYVDGTLGGAGHSKEILKRLSDKGTLIGIDRDIDALNAAKINLAEFNNVKYVHGNHDDKYERIPPDGCICIDDKIYVHEGVRIMGLGGSMRYKPGQYQYTERQMRHRVFKLLPKILWRRGFDILVTHAPAYQLNDARDLPHQGFKIFRSLIEKYHPKYFLHGHVHMSYGRQYKRYDKYMDTHVINAYDRCVFEFEAENPADTL